VSDVDDVIMVGKGGVYVDIHARPGARKPQVRGIHDHAIKIAVREAAQDGRANAAIVHSLADALGCTRKDIKVISGHTSRRKRLFISGDAHEITARIRNMLNGI